MAALLVGGTQGLVLLQEQPYGWEVWERTDREWAGRRVWALAETRQGLLAGTDAGLLRSTDRGGSWALILPEQIRTIASHPAVAGRLFAGAQPAAVWRSDDGGETWGQLAGPGTAEERARWHLPGATPLETVPIARVGAFAFDPRAPEIVYAGIEIGGVYRSDDGGEGWEARNEGLLSLDVHQFAPHPLEPETVFAATETGVYRTVDGGDRWEPLPLDAGAEYTRALVALPHAGPGDPPVLLAGPAEVDPWGWAEEADGARCRLMRSEDDGATWRHLGIAAGVPDHFEGLISTFVVDPADPYTVWLGTWDGRVYVSRDRGENWLQIAEDLGEIWVLCPLAEE